MKRHTTLTREALKFIIWPSCWNMERFEVHKFNDQEFWVLHFNEPQSRHFKPSQPITSFKENNDTKCFSSRLFSALLCFLSFHLSTFSASFYFWISSFFYINNKQKRKSKAKLASFFSSSSLFVVYSRFIMRKIFIDVFVMFLTRAKKESLNMLSQYERKACFLLWNIKRSIWPTSSYVYRIIMIFCALFPLFSPSFLCVSHSFVSWRFPPWIKLIQIQCKLPSNFQLRMYVRAIHLYIYCFFLLRGEFA